MTHDAGDQDSQDDATSNPEADQGDDDGEIPAKTCQPAGNLQIRHPRASGMTMRERRQSRY